MAKAKKKAKKKAPAKKKAVKKKAAVKKKSVSKKKPVSKAVKTVSNVPKKPEPRKTWNGRTYDPKTDSWKGSAL